MLRSTTAKSIVNRSTSDSRILGASPSNHVFTACSSARCSYINVKRTPIAARLFHLRSGPLEISQVEPCFQGMDTASARRKLVF